MAEHNDEKEPLNPHDTNNASIETHTLMSTIIKSSDNKFHRLVFDSTEQKLEFILLNSDSSPSTTKKMSIPFSKILSIRNSPVKLSKGLPKIIPTEKVSNPETPNALYVYYAIKRNVYVWRIREAVIFFTTTHDKKQWAEVLQKTWKNFEQRPKNLLIFINPFGGKGKAQNIYQKQVEPILELAEIKRKVVLTERADHAYDILQNLDKEEYHDIDGVVSVGGDGLFNEVLCSIVIRTQIENEKDIRDINIPNLTKPPFRFGIIGAGSANSIVSSVHGVDDCPTAAIHIAVGSKCQVDVCTVHEGDNLLRISANAISYGWLGDVLHDSEKYRYMGPCRYQWSALRTTIRHPTYFGRISFSLHESETEQKPELPKCKESCEYCTGGKVDPLYPYHWTTDFTHIICCVVPCVSPFTPYGLAPYTTIGDGSMDLALLPKVSRWRNLAVMRKVAMYGGKNLMALERALHCYRVKRWSYTPGTLLTTPGNSTDIEAARQGSWNLDGEILPQPIDKTLHFRVHPALINYFGREIDLDDHRYRRCYCCSSEKKISNLIYIS